MSQLLSLRDEPGTQREYETIYVLKQDTEPVQLQSINDRVRGLIEQDGGKLLTVENWGKRKLAYEIKKQNKGIYLYWRYLAKPQLIGEIERNLRMLDPVIRFLTVKVDENVDPNARPTDVNDETFVQAATTRPDEEDFYLGKASADEAWGLEDDDDFEDEGPIVSRDDSEAGSGGGALN